MWPTEILMVSPDYFSIDYSINPHMVDESGQLKKVDPAKGLQQWMHLKETFERLGLDVHVLEGREHFPDMVFCANTFFPFRKNGHRAALLSHMAFAERQGEVALTREWLLSQDFQVIESPVGHLEGMGDLLWNYESCEIFAGYGFRTKKATLDDVEKIVGQPLHKLQLVDPDFYHLDTCLMILDIHNCLYVPEAFSEQSIALIKSEFRNAQTISKAEAGQSFALNGVVVKPKNVVLPIGAKEASEKLTELGFQIHWVNTREFIKAGGSAFCMKNAFF